MLHDAEHRGAAQEQAPTLPCALAASKFSKGTSTEPNPSETGYGALQTSIAAMEPENSSAPYMAWASQQPTMGRTSMPAASSANSSAVPDRGAPQDSASPCSAVMDPHRGQPSARLVCLTSLEKPPLPEAQSREAAQTYEGVPEALKRNPPQAALLTEAVQPEAVLLGAESGTPAQDTGLLKTEEHALSRSSAVTVEFYAKATAECTRIPGATEQAPTDSQNRQVPEHSSAESATAQIRMLPASSGLLRTEEQAPGQAKQAAEELSAMAS